MLRTFNYTGRKKIPRSQVKIHLRPQNGHPTAFDAQFDLSDLDLPGHAQIYIEAYHRASFMRFHYGCISDIQVPQCRDLVDIEGGGTAQFRLKVIDESQEHGRVLAEADGISPDDSADSGGSRHSLLPVIICDLGDQVWRLSMDSGDGRPVLELNKSIEGIGQLAKTDNCFFALVYPAVVRAIFDQLIRGPEQITDLDGPADDWRYEWLRFALSLNSTPPPLSIPNEDTFDPVLDQKKISWIDDLVAAFCTRVRALERFTQMTNRGDR